MQRVGADDEDHLGVVDVADLGREAGLGQPDQRLAAGPARGARVDVRRAERLAQQALDQEALLVGGVADDRRDVALAGRLQALGRGLAIAVSQSVAAPPLSRGPSTRFASANISKP